MPEEDTVLPDFNLLKKPLADFANGLQTTSVILPVVNKNLTKLTTLNFTEILKKFNDSNTNDPAPLQSSVPVKKTNTSNPISESIPQSAQSPVKEQPSPVKEQSSPVKEQPPVVVNNQPQPPTGYGSFGRAPAPPEIKKSFLSNTLEKIQNTFNNVSNTMERTGDSFATTIFKSIKQRGKQSLIDAKEGYRSGVTGTVNKTGGGSTVSDVANKLGDMWKDQRDHETPLTKMVDAFKSFKSGNFKEGFKGIGGAASAYNDVAKSEGKLKKEEDKQSTISKAFEEQQKLIEQGFTPKEAAEKIKETGNKINEGVDELKQSTEPSFPVPNSPHAAEYISTASENINQGVLQLKEQSKKFLEFPTLQETGNVNNIIDFPAQTDQPTSADKTKSSSEGLRQRKQTGPEKVEIVNFDELAIAIADVLKESNSGGSSSGTSGSSSDDDGGGGLLDSLGGLLGFGGGGSNKKDKKKSGKNKTKTKTKTKAKPGLFKRIGGKFKGLGRMGGRIGGIAKLAGGAVAGGLLANKLKTKTPAASTPDKVSKTSTKTNPISDSVEKKAEKVSKTKKPPAAKPAATPAATPAAKPATPATKPAAPAAKPAATPAAKPAATPAAKPVNLPPDPKPVKPAAAATPARTGSCCL